MSKVYILPYLRKGLAKEITNSSQDGLRADFTVKADLYGNKAGAAENAPAVAIPTFTKPLSLAGPVDVKAVSEMAISEVVPADNSVGYSMDYMPYIEFYEEDFPWRYTPKKASNKLEPWLLLLACKDDEFTLAKDRKGFRRVTFDPKGAGFYPKVADFYKLAHVQVTMPDWITDEPAHYVNENPDDGISRLFCFRQLEANTHYTMFLVPAFELGRRAGMGESLEGAGYQQLAWNDKSAKLSFPVYYQWSFKTAGKKFIDLARAQKFISDDEFKALPDGLKLDIQETGLKAYRTSKETSNEDKVLVDMPAALVKKGFDESKLTEEVVTTKLKSKTSIHMTDELRQLQGMSPVFSENAGLSETEDPWVVPPVYGARHILATQKDLDNESLFLNKLNLRFRNRAAAGLGVSVVKRNQEAFVNRAWGMIDTINNLNQRIREYYEAVKANGASSKKATSLRTFQFKAYASGLQADAAIRIANAQSAAKVNAVDLAMDLQDPALSSLSVRSSVLQPIIKASGICKDELNVISDSKQWKKHWADIIRASQGFKFLTGGIPYYEGGIDERFGFLRPIFSIKYPTELKLGQEGSDVYPITDDEDKVLHFQSYDFTDCLPARSPFFGIKDYMQVIGWLEDDDITYFNEGNVYYIRSLDSMLSTLKGAEEEFNKRWYESLGTKLHQQCLPVETAVFKGQKQVGYAFFMRDQAYEPFAGEYPNGFCFRFDYKTTALGQSFSFDYKLYILPQERFDEVENGSVRYNSLGASVPVIRDPEREGRFKLEKDSITKNTAISYSSDDSSKWNYHIWGIRNHMVKESIYYTLWSTLVEKWGASTQTVAVYKKGGFEFYYTGKMKSGIVRRLWMEWGDYDRLYIMGEYYTHSKKKKLGGRTYYYGTWGFSISNSDACVSTRPELPNIYLVSMPKLMDKIKLFLSRLDWVDDIFWSPNHAKLESTSLESLPEVTADMVGRIEEKVKEMNSFFDKVCQEADKFRDILQQANLLPTAEKVATSDDVEAQLDEGKMVDADKENEKRLVEIANQFAERGMTLDLSVSNFDGKYPIMAYPIFPDPTSFYLRELSERFILPSVDQLKMNSISCFVTNPIFEEAFLAGMNTEMGRELLWREYPTDERGSYFRKFWDQVTLPSDFSNGYFDVKYLHNWKKRLGANHEDGKGQLVVFIIKSELMMQYPQTGITLSAPKGGILEIVLMPTMTGWLADDTYMAGFDISKLETTEGLYLTFTETDKSQRFSRVPLGNTEKDKDQSGDLSSVFAVKHRNNGSVWGHEIDKAYLVVNNLHLDDGGTGTQIVQKPKPGSIGRFDVDQNIKSELKR